MAGNKPIYGFKMESAEDGFTFTGTAEQITDLREAFAAVTAQPPLVVTDRTETSYSVLTPGTGVSLTSTDSTKLTRLMECMRAVTTKPFSIA